MEGLGIGQAITGILGQGFNIGSSIYKQNYMEKMQKEAWTREDNAIQRKVRDMQSAGLNPALMYGIGSGAPTSSPVDPGQAHFGPEMQESLSRMAQIKVQESQIGQTKAQTALTNAQAENVEADTKLKSIEGTFRSEKLAQDIALTMSRKSNVDADTAYTALKTIIDERDLDFWTTYGQAYNRGQNNLIGDIIQVYDIFRNNPETVNDATRLIRDVVFRIIKSANPVTQVKELKEKLKDNKKQDIKEKVQSFVNKPKEIIGNIKENRSQKKQQKEIERNKKKWQKYN